MITENETVTVVRSKSTVRDRFNNLKPDWTNVDRFTDLRAQVQPMNSEEQIRDRDTVTIHLHLWAEWIVQDLRHTDRVEVRGDSYEVDGAVDLYSETGKLHHYHAVLRRVV